MKLNGKDLDLAFNGMDANDMERYDRATTYIQNRDGEFAKNNAETPMKTYEMIRWHCHSIFEFFNIIFGEGTDRLIFGDETALNICFAVLADFTLYVSDQSRNVVTTASKYLATRIDRKIS